ncbi:MAG: hypothetical protein KDC26_10350 [Armatimonadetes bacterium]|nr:hypothetical protein [Armatimonadota bacterium]
MMALGIVGLVILAGAILFPIFAEVNHRDKNRIARSNAKQFGVALMVYMEDHDKHLPSFKNKESFRAAIYPYIKNDEQTDYVISRMVYTNAGLEGLPLDSLSDADKVVLFAISPEREDSNGVFVVFANSRTKLINDHLILQTISESDRIVLEARQKAKESEPKPEN